MSDHLPAVIDLLKQRHPDLWCQWELCKRPDWLVLTPPEPCECCGTLVVVLEQQGQRGWYEPAAPDRQPRRVGDNYRIAMAEHSRQRCARARAER